MVRIERDRGSVARRGEEIGAVDRHERGGGIGRARAEQLVERAAALEDHMIDEAPQLVLHRGEDGGRHLGKRAAAARGLELAEPEPTFDHVLHLDAGTWHREEPRRLRDRVLGVGELSALGGREERVVGSAAAEEEGELRRELVVGERRDRAGELGGELHLRCTHRPPCRHLPRRRGADLAAVERARCEENGLGDEAKPGVGALAGDAGIEDAEQIDELLRGGRSSERARRDGLREACRAGARGFERLAARPASDRRCEARDEREVAVELRTRHDEGARIGLPPVDLGIAEEIGARRHGSADDVAQHIGELAIAEATHAARRGQHRDLRIAAQRRRRRRRELGRRRLPAPVAPERPYAKRQNPGNRSTNGPHRLTTNAAARMDEDRASRKTRRPLGPTFRADPRPLRRRAPRRGGSRHARGRSSSCRSADGLGLPIVGMTLDADA